MAADSRYYLQFDFYFKRTSFRSMTGYYKNHFRRFFEDKKQKKGGIENVHTAVSNLIKDAFPGLFEKSSKKFQLEMIELIMMVVFTHRHNKNDKFLMDLMTDFDVVRNPMYKYSRIA